MRPKRILAVLMSLCIVLAGLVLAPGAAQAAAITTYISVLTPSGASGKKVLDIRNWSLSDRGIAHLWDLRTTGNVDNQRWTIIPAGTYTNGVGDVYQVYELRNLYSGKCLDKSLDTTPANGNAVYQYSCSHTPNQKWAVIPLGTSKWVGLMELADFRCLDSRGATFTNGAVMQVWDCQLGWNQRWNIY